LPTKRENRNQVLSPEPFLCDHFVFLLDQSGS